MKMHVYSKMRGARAQEGLGAASLKTELWAGSPDQPTTVKGRLLALLCIVPLWLVRRPSHSPNSFKRRGHELRRFTLVEVLAALVLLGIILPVAMRGISLATRTAGAARGRMVAASLAETTLNELVLSGEWQEGDLSGDYGEEWPEYRWRSQVDTWEEGNLRRLDVRVEWAAEIRDRSVTLSTLVRSGED